MGKWFTYSLIFIQFITAFQFLTPYLSYQLNYDFIVNELCRSKYEPRFVECNGACFLKKAHKDVADSQTEEQATLNISNPIPIHFVEIAFELSAPQSTSTTYTSFSEDIIDHSSSPSTPPPRLV